MASFRLFAGWRLLLAYVKDQGSLNDHPSILCGNSQKLFFHRLPLLVDTRLAPRL